MRKAKIATTIFMLLGVALMLSMPLVLRAKPASDAADQAKKHFAIIFTGYSILLLIIFFATVVSAWIVVRKQREAFREASMNNLKELIEGTLNDHGQKKDS